jgi:hypothetical protein
MAASGQEGTLTSPQKKNRLRKPYESRILFPKKFRTEEAHARKLGHGQE